MAANARCLYPPCRIHLYWLVFFLYWRVFFLYWRVFFSPAPAYWTPRRDALAAGIWPEAVLRTEGQIRTIPPRPSSSGFVRVDVDHHQREGPP